MFCVFRHNLFLSLHRHRVKRLKKTCLLDVAGNFSKRGGKRLVLEQAQRSPQQTGLKIKQKVTPTACLSTPEESRMQSRQLTGEPPIAHAHVSCKPPEKGEEVGFDFDASPI